jgi:uncharacterized membrane protein YkoI
MRSSLRFALAAIVLFALPHALTPARADEAERAMHTGTIESAHACLNQRERRTEVEGGKVLRLAAAMHAIKSRMQGTLVRARLCHGHDGLVYVLTVLAHDGKVARLTVDAVKGTFVGGL